VRGLLADEQAASVDPAWLSRNWLLLLLLLLLLLQAATANDAGCVAVTCTVCAAPRWCWCQSGTGS
jgi:hypothetical protein